MVSYCVDCHKRKEESVIAHVCIDCYDIRVNEFLSQPEEPQRVE